jgi:thioredoxin 1
MVMEPEVARSPQNPISAMASDESLERDGLLRPHPLLLAFWAPWCSPCETLLPTLELLATRHSGRLEVIRVDADRCPRAAARFGVTNLPTVLLLEAGVPRWVTVGIRPLEEYQRLLEESLPG